jgi:hypothetical protein
MSPHPKRLRDIRDAFTALFPLAPFSDAEPIRERAARKGMNALTADTAVWLAAITHLRHEHTEYDQLLAEGYDRESARFFIIDAINDTLTRWRAARFLVSAEDFDPLDDNAADDASESAANADAMMPLTERPARSTRRAARGNPTEDDQE